MTEDMKFFDGKKILSDINNSIDAYGCHTCMNEFFTCEFSPYAIVDKKTAINQLKLFTNDTNLDGYKTSKNSTMGAIELAKNVQLDHYGMLLIDLRDPVDVVNQVIYIRAENIFNNLLVNASLDADSALNDANKQALKQAIKNTMKEGF